MLRIGRTIAIQGIDHLWVVMVQKDAIFIDLLQFVPLLIGILLAEAYFAFALFTEENGHVNVGLWRTCTGDLFCYEFYYDGSLSATTFYK